MRKIFVYERVQQVLEVLVANPYSALWDLIEDFEYNGHIIKVKSSHQLRQVIIDGAYQYIGGDITIWSNGVNYTPMEYIKVLLNA